MAVAFDAVGPAGGAGAGGTPVLGTNTLGWTHVCASNATVLVVGVTVGSSGSSDSTFSISAIQYNGVELTQFGSTRHSNDGPAGYCQIWYLASPATGSNSIVLHYNDGGGGSANDAIQAGSISFTGSDTTTPLVNYASAAGDGSTASVGVTSAAGSKVVDVAVCGTGVSSFTASSGTLRWNKHTNGSSAGGNGAQQVATGASSVTMSYTLPASDWWAIIGASVLGTEDPPPSAARLGWFDPELNTLAWF